ncbi:DUF4192 domain-containing protein [Thermoactinospora rubra]|uniref:DUF4192 domain-containing protein n=1 Tax=Thermoactinospora rubra TaxID=1088767 RepID=UPI000A0FECA3|nr:DUF4192 domain-containing protein [Thermoactinospora rubra]
MTTDAAEAPLSLTSPFDILAAVPYLLGFHPADSLIVLGLVHTRLQFTARWGLPLPDDALAPLGGLVRREGITHLIAVGYGPGPLVTPATDELRRVAAGHGTPVTEALRAEGGRFWSYTCDLPGCCPPDGTPYDSTTTEVAARATLKGMVAHPDRESLERVVAPSTGPVRLAMRRATAEAAACLATRMSACRDPDTLAKELVAEGLARVHESLALAAAGGRLDDRQAARLGFDLAVVRVRDEAWTLSTESHLALWKDLTRRMEPRFVPPAASLLAMASWRTGDCVLASIALERALAIDPDYSMAVLLRHALDNLLAPRLLTERMPTPSELDATMGTPTAAWLIPMLELLDDAGPTARGQRRSIARHADDPPYP